MAKKRPTKKENLTEKQIRFSQEYIIDLNGEQAAIRAGYSETSAKTTASEILTYPNVQKYIQELLNDRATRTQATADKAISEIYYLISFDVAEVFDDKGRLIDIHKIPKLIRKAIASIEIEEEYNYVKDKRGRLIKNHKELTGYVKKIRFWDKTKAIEMLAKHLKLLTDKTELSGTGGIPLLPPMIIFQDKEGLPTKTEGSGNA